MSYTRECVCKDNRESRVVSRRPAGYVGGAEFGGAKPQQTRQPTNSDLPDPQSRSLAPPNSNMLKPLVPLLEFAGGDTPICSNLRFEQASGWPDSNRRPPAPKAGALPNCATARGKDVIVARCDPRLTNWIGVTPYAPITAPRLERFKKFCHPRPICSGHET